MIDLIYNSPNFLLFVFICFIVITVSLVATKLIHLKIPLKFRYGENQSVICVSQLIGIMYAVLIGFIILYELNNFNKANDAEASEAKSMFAIFRMAHALPEPSSSKIRNLILDYANNVINNEWPAMQAGLPVSNVGTNIIEAISNEIRSFNHIHLDNLIVAQALNAISTNTNNLFDEHRERVSRRHTSLSSNIWFVLLLGSVLTIGINCLLGMECRLHITCVVFIALMVSAVLYLIITLDRPYRGDFAIKPTTFSGTIEYITRK